MREYGPAPYLTVPPSELIPIRRWVPAVSGEVLPEVADTLHLNGASDVSATGSRLRITSNHLQGSFRLLKRWSTPWGATRKRPSEYGEMYPTRADSPRSGV